MWVLLLEKAYAKIHGSYAAIESGYPNLAFRDLTGAPSEWFGNTNVNDTWKYLVANFNKGFLMVATSKRNKKSPNVIY